MPKWTGLKAPRKFPAGGRGSRPSITISKLASSARNTAGREQSDLLVGSEVEGSGQGHSLERATRTNNEHKLQACQEKFDQAFSAPFRPARRGGNEGAGFVLSGRALGGRNARRAGPAQKIARPSGRLRKERDCRSPRTL